MLNFKGRNNITTQTASEGVIDKVIHQGHKWRVRVHGVYWFAQSVKPAHFLPGDYVQVVGRQNMTLLIDTP